MTAVMTTRRTRRCPTTPAGVNVCQEALRAVFSDPDVTVTVTVDIPGLATLDAPRGYLCRHGLTYWVTVTERQD